MPRLSVSEGEEAVPKKRAPRPRTTKASSDDGAVSPRPRTRTTRVHKPVTPDMPESVVERKAPTPIAAARRSAKRGSKVLIGGLVIAAVLLIAGIGIGLSGSGQIDVVAVVNERNEKVNRGEVRDAGGNPVTVAVPVQGGDIRPNGGLTIADPATVTPPPSPVETTPTTTATTTEAQADPLSTENNADVPAVEETDPEPAATETTPEAPSSL